jgi:uncharacterized protein YnzC (UPF0291/DUF896 family)
LFFLFCVFLSEMIPTVAKVKKVTEEEKHHQEHLQEQELCKLRREVRVF